MTLWPLRPRPLSESISSSLNDLVHTDCPSYCTNSLDNFHAWREWICDAPKNNCCIWNPTEGWLMVNTSWGFKNPLHSDSLRINDYRFFLLQIAQGPFIERNEPKPSKTFIDNNLLKILLMLQSYCVINYFMKCTSDSVISWNNYFNMLMTVSTLGLYTGSWVFKVPAWTADSTYQTI